MADWDVVSVGQQNKDPWSVVKVGGDLTPSTNQQKAGAVPTLQDFKAMIPEKQDILPMAGSMLGAAGRTTGIGALYAGLGAGAGEAANQFGQRFGKIPGEPPQTSTEAVKRIGERAVVGAAGEGLARTVINPLMSKLGKFIFPGGSAATQAAVTAAESEGIKPLPSTIGNKAVAGAEKLTEYSPFGGQVTKARMKMVEDFGNYAKRVGDAIHPSKNAEVNGSLIKEATGGFYENFNNVKQELYNSVLPQIKDKPVELTSTFKTLEDIVSRHQAPGGEKGATFFSDLLEQIKPKQIGDPSILTPKADGPINNFEQLKHLGTNIYKKAKFFDPSNPGLQGDMKALAGAIMEDKDRAIVKYGDAGIKEALGKANEYNAIGKDILKSKIYKALVASPQGNEYKIAFNPRDLTAYDTVKEVVGQDLMGNMSRQWFDDNILKTATKDGVVSPKILLNNLDKQAALLPKIAADFPKAAAQIDKLRQVASLMTKNSDVIGGSQTGAYQTSIAGSGAALWEIASSIPTLFHSPMQGLKGIAVGTGALAASKGAASLATSDFARNFITRGYPAMQPAVEGLVNAASPAVSQLGAKGLANYTKRNLE